MSKVIAICGKVGSGKTYYANQIINEKGGVLLSDDELLHDLFPGIHPKNHRDSIVKIDKYLLKKTISIVNSGCDVILDWGFWKKAERKEISNYFHKYNINVEWYYIDISNDVWKQNIQKRNTLNFNDGSSFYLDEEIIKKVNEQFEEPDESEKFIRITK